MKNKEVLRWYLRGLFDADGTLPKDGLNCKQLFIDIALKDKCMIEDVKEALEVFGINTYEPYPRKSKSPSSDKQCITWELRIRKHSEIKRFLMEVGFYHFNKSERIISVLSRLDL